MKNFYENPEMEIIEFSVEDVIATSSLPPVTSDMENMGPVN